MCNIKLIKVIWCKVTLLLFISILPKIFKGIYYILLWCILQGKYIYKSIVSILNLVK